jgi:hypothetical protein
LKLAVGIKAVALALGVTYIIIYYCKVGKGITMTKKQRERREQDIQNPETDSLTKRIVKTLMTYSALGLFCAMVMTAWVVFVKYLI